MVNFKFVAENVNMQLVIIYISPKIEQMTELIKNPFYIAINS